jgi:tetratricopeptide (TPR) repeat protein
MLRATMFGSDPAVRNGRDGSNTVKGVRRLSEPNPATPTASATPPGWLAGLLLAGITVLLYLPVTQYGFIWDDEHYVQYNQTLHDFEGLVAIWTDTSATPQYYPLIHTSYWLEYQLWGLDPRGYHTVNILLHALAAVLLWRTLRLLELPGAWIAAAVFAVHPVNVESVAWITERKNVLALCFYLGAAFFYLRYALGSCGEEEKAKKKAGGPLDYVVALLLFVAAMFSKTIACSLPATLILVLWWKRGKVARRRWLELAPFFVLGLGLGLQTAYLEKAQVGAAGVDWDFSLAERCLIAGRALWFYAGTLFWPNPDHMAFFYPRWQIDGSQAWQYLFPAAALAVLGIAWLARKRFGIGPFVALLIFGGTLLPALGFIDVYPMRFSFVADHFQYLATPALIGLVVASGAHAARRAGAVGVRIGAGGATLVLILLASLSWRQMPQFRDLEALWRTTLEKNPSSWAAHHNLGMDLADAGQTDEAIGHFRRALDLRPNYEEASNALGIAYTSRGLSREAAEQYRATLQMNEDSLPALINLARILTSNRDPALLDLGEAECLATHAREITQGRDTRTLAVLAEVYFEQGRLDEAIEAALRATEAVDQDREPELAREAIKRLEFYRLVRTSEQQS